MTSSSPSLSPDASKSSAPSRRGTPSRLSSRSPSRVPSRSPSSHARSPFPPTLRPAPSFSSLRASPSPLTLTGSPQRLTATAIPAHLKLAAQDLDSAASSVVGVGSMSMSSAEGILMNDGEIDAGTETETETEAGAENGDVEEGPATSGVTTAIGQTEESTGDEESRHALRNQLRRTLTQNRDLSAEPPLSPKSKGKQRMPDNDEDLDVHIAVSAPPRQYFVLTDAGKPVFVSDASPLTGDQDALASTMGLMQALVSVFLDDGDKLRCINAGRTRICFLLRSPLYYVCASNWGEPESVIRSHLEYLHLQILSVVSGAQLRRIFERRANFDLRRLLSGAETFLHMLLTRMQTDLAMSTSSLLCLPLDPGLRRKVGEALIPSKMKDILYVMLIARGRVVTLVRPKKHSVHPADLHILLNTIHAPAIVEAPASWLPVCLPKFNPSGFLHAYVSFPRHGELAPSPPSSAQAPADANSAETPTTDTPASPEPVAPPESPGTPTGLGLVCVSGGGGGEFEAIRAWCASATQALESAGALSAIERAVRRGHTEYGVHALDVPGLRHFVYKSRAHVQVTHPLWGEEYADGEAQRRLITLYQTLHDAIHGKSGQRETLKLQYIRTERESVMGWITQPFELYISMSPSLSKATVVSAANAVVRWVKREEAKLFLRDAPVF